MDDGRRVRGFATTHRYLEILEFTHFCRFYSFTQISENHREKVIINKITVSVVFEVDMGDTSINEHKRNDE